jgi:polysaccharide export outer membrane protein
MHRFCLIILALMMFCGCESFSSAGDPTRVAAEQLQPGVIVPQLRTGVKVRISVLASGEPVMEEVIMEVSASGDIVLPYIDRVACAGMTIKAFQDELTKRYREFYVEPLVSAYYVPMSEGGSSPYGRVLVTGCVGREGMVDIPQTCDLTVMQALQLAGGMGMWANINGVLLTRKLADGTRQQVSIDTERIGRRGATDQDILLMPGDVLHVPESNW